MCAQIVRLPEIVINQIAAGEVVENAASVVKELIENSRDAEARQIEVTFEGELIRIEDDGVGMGREDALLCLERHATSKIRRLEDLETLLTMGFRGEALASIASVSRLEIRTSNGVEATRIVAEGGVVQTVEPCARNRGTTIEIRDLFFNTPARKKFQKSHSANAAQVRRVVEALALASPEIGFALTGKFRLEATPDWKERARELLGPQEHEVQFTQGAVRIWGSLSAPQGNRTGQHLYLNRRPIFSPLVSRAVKQGFGTRMGEKDHPSFVLFLDIPPDTVDVNVHPQKREVRFRDEGLVFRFFEKAVSSAFVIPSLPEPVYFEPPPIQWKFEERPVFEAPAVEEMPLPVVFSDRLLAVRGPFLWVEREELLLVDLRGAQARVLFEGLRKEKGVAQSLLLPLTVELSRDEALQGEEWAEKLGQLGVECRFLGPRTLSIDALPPHLDDFPRFFAEWKRGTELRALASRFCRGRKLSYSMDEAALVWRQLQRCDDTRYDPLGQPIWVVVTEGLCEKWIRG